MSNWHVKQNVMQDYLQVCKEAVEDDKVFRYFKSDKRFTSILEHCRIDIATNYLNQIKKDNPNLLNIKAFKDNDKFGDAKLQSIKYNGQNYKYSTSTLQYIGVLSNLIKYLPSLNNMHIVEIGGGYGGQCKIIYDYFKPKSYTIIDLPEVCDLQKKYLKLSDIDIISIHAEDVNEIDSDLIISNYALTEVREPLLSKYTNEVVLNATNGYITCNRVEANSNLIKTLRENKLCIEKKDILGESNDNCIIYWK